MASLAGPAPSRERKGLVARQYLLRDRLPESGSRNRELLCKLRTIIYARGAASYNSYSLNSVRARAPLLHNTTSC